MSEKVKKIILKVSKNEKEFLEKLTLLVLIELCLLIPVLLLEVFGNKADAHDWINFAGTCFGSSIGIVFAYFNTKFQLEKSKENDLRNELKLREIENLALILNKAFSLLIDIENAREELKNFEHNKENVGYSFTNTFKMKKSINDFSNFYNSHLAFLDLNDAKIIGEKISDLKNIINNFMQENETIFFSDSYTPFPSEISDSIDKQSGDIIISANKLSKTIEKIYNKAKASNQK